MRKKAKPRRVLKTQIFSSQYILEKASPITTRVNRPLDKSRFSSLLFK